MKLGVASLAMLSLCRCSSYSAADQDGFAGTARTMVMVERICTPPIPDAGFCDPARVRGLTRSARCLASSRLSAHGGTPPDGGSSCPPVQ